MVRRGSLSLLCVCSTAVFCTVFMTLRASASSELSTTQNADATTSSEHDVTFDQVLPILQANCIACHNQSIAESDLSLETPAAMVKGGSLGPAIDLQSPKESLLLKLASHSEEPVMPPEDNDARARRLTPDELTRIESWIAGGAKPAAATTASSLNWQPINPALKAVYALDMDWHGRFVAAGRGGRVTVYDRANENTPQHLVDPELNYLVPPGHPGVAHRDFVQAVAFHPGGKEIATAGFQVVKIWRRNPAPDSLLDCRVPPDGRLIVSGLSNLLSISSEGQLSRCPSATAEVLLEGHPVTAADELSTGASLIIAGTADGQLLVHGSEGDSPPTPFQVSDSPIAEVVAHASEP